jgi:hypothetical protein
MATTNTVNKSALEKENKELKDSLSQMQEQMKQMMKQMQVMQSNSQKYVGVRDDITSRKIPVISLLHNPAVLSTERYGAGTPYEFPTYGYERKIKYTDLEKIVALTKSIAFDTNCPSSFFERGDFYIADHDAVVELGLDSFYETIFDKSKVDQCIELKDETAVNLFKGANDSVKESIIRAIIDNINNGKQYDLNMIAILSKAYGKDVQELAEKSNQISKSKK